MPKIKVLDTELEFNALNADTIDRVTLEADRLAHIGIPKGKTPGDTIRFYCQVVFDSFDNIFGEGTSERIFGGVYDFEKAAQAINQLENELAKTFTSIKAIGSNRAQRRSKKK